MTRGCSEQQQRLTEGVELKLGVGVVADDVGTARVAGQLQGTFTGHGAAGDGVGGFEVGPVGQQAFGDEADRIIEQ